VKVRRGFVQPSESLSMRRQCELLRVNRSSLYYESVRPDAEDLTLMRRIDELHLQFPFYGSRRVTRELRSRGLVVNRKRIQRLMRLMGIEAIAPKPNTSVPRKEHKVYPYLLQGIGINRPDQVWCSDITYIRLCEGFCLSDDWHSRYVLSWEVSVTMDDEFCVNALNSAIRRHGLPEIFNTDQGSQYTGDGFTGTLNKHGIRISMDGKGRAMDNIFIERLWRSVKYEEIYLKEYSNVKELIKSLKQYFEFYNLERPHQTIEGQTPAEVYWIKSAVLKAV